MRANRDGHCEPRSTAADRRGGIGSAGSVRSCGATSISLRSSSVRIVELIYWPFLQMLTWGFLQKFLASTNNPYAVGAGVLIGAVLLWDILFRSNLGFFTTFIEEMWSRNLGNLLISPLRPHELVMALCIWSVLRLSVGMIPVALAAFVHFRASTCWISVFGSRSSSPCLC